MLTLPRSSRMLVPTSVPRVHPSLLGVHISEAGIGLQVTDKGKEVYFPFGPSTSSPIGHAIVDRYTVLTLVTTCDPQVFRLNWVSIYRCLRSSYFQGMLLLLPSADFMI